jgi:transcription antitermination factor NusG
MIKVPLFPGYLFVKTDLNPHEHVEILRTIGAVRLIGNKQGPIAVANETLESLKIMVNTDLPISTGNRLRRGDRVMVIQGPFAGVIGTFVRYKGNARVVVNIEALGQFAAVEVDIQDVEKLPAILS